jgi:hypothetical protein
MYRVGVNIRILGGWRRLDIFIPLVRGQWPLSVVQCFRNTSTTGFRSNSRNIFETAEVLSSPSLQSCCSLCVDQHSLTVYAALYPRESSCSISLLALSNIMRTGSRFRGVIVRPSHICVPCYECHCSDKNAARFLR